MVDALLQAAPWWAWAGFHAFVFLMLALDLGVFNRRVHAPTVREAATWSAVWIGLALVFNALIFQAEGPQKGLEWLTGYVLEKSLSVDNLFVFVLVFQSFQVDLRHQHRVLFWGVLGALIMRAAMILAGTALLNRFEWMMYVFGGFLVYTGLKMLLVKEVEADPTQNPMVRAFKRLVPYDETGGHEHFWVVREGKRFATPMLLVLITIEVTDLVFAVDSIPAVLAVSRDPFVVYTSNIFAILGLRSLYFLLAKMMDRFHRLKTGLAVVLAFVGVKMCIAEWVHIPVQYSLLVIAAVLAGSVVASLAWPSEQDGTP
ncbi:MAG: TerC family protein [Holophagaceae bacterium]|uniref:TerC family protein n=1 Tax=Candidatus Geothrix skivensis TaxID=2954439 RepID=A0A9D7XMG7_9BACT|nr:TerC family protein [Candidatus Geothrix skivensis]